MFIARAWITTQGDPTHPAVRGMPYGDRLVGEANMMKLVAALLMPPLVALRLVPEGVRGMNGSGSKVHTRGSKTKTAQLTTVH